MPLRPQHVEVPLSAGLDESTNQEESNGFLELENFEWKDANSISARPSFFQRAVWTADNERGLIATETGLAILRNGGILPYIPGTGLQSEVLTYTILHENVATLWNGRRVSRVESAVIGDTAFVVMEEFLETSSVIFTGSSPRQLSWRAIDMPTNTVRASGVIAGSGTIGAYAARMCVITLSNAFGLAWLEGSSHTAATIKWTTWNGTTLAQGSTFTAAAGIAQTLTPEQGIDVFAIAGTFNAVIAWSNGTNIALTIANTTGAAIPVIDTFAACVGGAIAVTAGGTNNEVVVAFSGVANTEAATYNTSLVRSGGDTAVILGTGLNLRTGAVFIPGTTTVRVLAENGASSQLKVANYFSSTHTHAAVASYERTYLTTKPWVHPQYNIVLAGVSPTNALSSGYRTVAVIDTTTGIPAAQLAFDEVGPLNLAAAGGPAPVSDPGTSFTVNPWYIAVAVTEESDDAANDGVEVSRARLVRLLAATGTVRTVPKTQLEGVAFIAGSVPRIWDGQSAVPLAFPTAPNAPTLSVGGAGVLTGSYAYCTVLEYTDALGNIQVSPPSVPQSLTPATQSVDVALVFGFLPTGTVRCKVFRTLAGGSDFFLLRVFVVSAVTATVNDNIADITLEGHEALYTTGGVLESELAPPLTTIVAHRNRLFGISADDPRVIRFTKEVVPPMLPQWHAALTIRVDNDGGNPVGLASMDDKVLVFQPNRICAITGPGPDNLASVSTLFPIPELVARGVGVDPDSTNSIVETPVGVVFRHTSGVYLISRDLQVSPIGLPVQRTLGTQNITAARYLPSRHQVWLFGISGLVLVWDVRYARWTTFSGPWGSASDAIEVDGTVWVLDVSAGSGNAALYELLPAGTADHTAAGEVLYVRTASLPWFRPSVGGQMRVWKFGMHGRLPSSSVSYDVRVAAYTQKTTVNHKDSEVPDATLTWPNTYMSTFPDGGFTVIGRLVTQRCEAVRVVVTLTPTVGVEGPTLTKFSYHYGIEPGFGKVPALAKPSAT